MYYRKCLMALLSLISVAVNAQETDITGLWKGTLYNDTTQMNYQYEIGISKEKGKYVGFSHTWFVLDDKHYYGVKKVSIRIANDGKIIVEDDGLISNNYPVPPNKNVRQLNVLTLDAASPIMTLTGPFSTNRTKEYHVLTGSVSLQRKNDFWQSALIPHLEELGKANDLSFVRMQKEAANKLRSDANAIAANSNINKQAEEKQSAEATLKKETAAKEKAAKKEEQVQLKLAAEIAKVELEAQEAAEKAANAAEIAKEKERKKEEAALAKQAEVLAKAEAAAKDAAQKATAKQAVAQQKEAAEKIKLTREIEKKEAAQAKKEAAEKASLAKQAAAAAEEKSAKATAAIAKQAADEKAQATEQSAAAEKANKTTENSKTAIASTQKVDNRKEAPVLVSKPAASVNERQTIVQQTVSFSSDSLLLTLYDNGEVDGDTVSVLLNGQLILEKQGLSTVAIKKTIYIPANTDRMELVMYAESLGSIPPNTGLLVIRDGKQLYEVRFSGDLQKNAAIVFNRKKE
jgi:archaellum component FlaF (FlaF/FlaG flagellin family)